MPLSVVEISKRYRENNREAYRAYQKEYHKYYKLNIINKLKNDNKFNAEYQRNMYEANKHKYKEKYNLNKLRLYKQRILKKEIKIFLNILFN